MNPSALGSSTAPKGVAPASNPQVTAPTSGTAVKNLMGAVNSGNANSFSSALSAAGFGMSGSDITFNGQNLGTQQQLSSEVSNASTSTSLQDATENYANWATAHPILSTIVSTVVGNIIPGAGLLASVIKMIGNHYINKNIKSAQSNTAAQGNYFIDQSTNNPSQDYIGNASFNGAYPNVSINYGSNSNPTVTVGQGSWTDQSGGVDYGSTQDLVSQESWDGSMGGGGGGGGDGCPDINAWVIKKVKGIPKKVRAHSVVVGDELRVINPKTGALRWGKVSYSKKRAAHRCTVYLKNGCELTCSLTAPLGTMDGCIKAPEAFGAFIANRVSGKFDHTECVQVVNEALGFVQHITCENDFILAGNTRNAMMAHHNMKALAQTDSSGSDNMSFDDMLS